MTDAPKIFEIYQSLSHIQENRLMYAILCYLAKSGCQIDTNNKGNKILHWILNKEMQDLICSYINRRPGRMANGATDSGQLYTNVQPGPADIGNSSASNADFNDQSASPSTAAVSATSSLAGNPPTPMRRHRDPAPNGGGNIDDGTTSNNHNIRQNVASGSGTTSDTIASSTAGQFDEANGGAAAQISPQKNNATANALATPSSSKDSNTNNSHVSRKESTHQSMTSSSGSGSNSQNPVVSVVSNKIINQANSSQTSECIVCNEIIALVLFEPCTHQIACNECSLRMKKCLSCGTLIERRCVGGNDLTSSNTTNVAVLFNDITGATNRQPSADRLRYLENKILEIEETHCCGICMERRRNVAFLCGHGACSKCAETLKTCHMCRKTIVKKINLY